jgi:hypothetical protein
VKVIEGDPEAMALRMGLVWRDEVGRLHPIAVTAKNRAYVLRRIESVVRATWPTASEMEVVREALDVLLNFQALWNAKGLRQ